MNDENQLPEFEDLDPKEDKLQIGFTILSFCIPIAGAVIYFMNKDDSPKKATTACYAALAGMGIGLVLNILSGIIGASSGY